MKKEFPEFYRLTDKQLSVLGQRAVIAFDASFLLDLYRYSQGVAKNMFSVLEGLGEQVWLPHQAAYEFHNNRLVVLAGLRSKHSDVVAFLESDGNKLIEKIENACKKHPLLDSKQIVDPIQLSLDKARASLASITDKHARLTLATEDDAVWNRIAKIFAGRIGREFSEEEMRTIEQEGKKRFDRKIPPGFAWKKKLKPPSSFEGVLKRRCSEPSTNHLTLPRRRARNKVRALFLFMRLCQHD